MIQKTILAVLLLLLSFNLSAQDIGKLSITELDLSKEKLPENIEVITSLDDLDSNVYIIRNGKESLKDIAEKLYLSTINGLPAYVYLKELNKITDEHQLLREGTVIKLSSNAVMPTQKQIKLALLQPFKNVHIVKEPTENLYTICKKYGLKPKKHNGYLQMWNNIEFSDNFLAIGRAILLTGNAKKPTQEQINQLFTTKKQRVWVSAKLSELKNLTSVTLQGNTNDTIWKELALLPNLYHINFVDSQINFDAIKNIKNLNELYLDFSNNNLDTIPSQLYAVKQLTKLNLRDNQYKSLPKEIEQLVNLKEFYLDNNQLTYLPETIGNLKKLEVLILPNNQIKELPETIGKLTNLHLLLLNNNHIHKLPSEIGKLKNIFNFHLTQNQLTELPKEIVKLQNIANLALNCNQFQYLPEEIGYLKNLSILNMSNNLLKNLFQKPEKSNLSNWHYDKFSKAKTPLKGLKKLQHLYLSYNQISNIPRQIGELKKLELLYLNGNEISELPKQMKKLINLRELSIGSNPISLVEINKTLVLLPQLEVLYLGDLGLNTLPESVLSLKNLKKLYLNNYDKKQLRPNSFSQVEQEKIKKMLPQCEVIFNLP